MGAAKSTPIADTTACIAKGGVKGGLTITRLSQLQLLLSCPWLLLVAAEGRRCRRRLSHFTDVLIHACTCSDSNSYSAFVAIDLLELNKMIAT
jgi:hypothetical protein